MNRSASVSRFRPVAFGKSTLSVGPVTYALPCASTATPNASSFNEPPRNVAYSRRGSMTSARVLSYGPIANVICRPRRT
jgi:hypothetical protein